MAHSARAEAQLLQRQGLRAAPRNSLVGVQVQALEEAIDLQALAAGHEQLHHILDPDAVWTHAAHDHGVVELQVLGRLAVGPARGHDERELVAPPVGPARTDDDVVQRHP
eukprot:7991572-Pyramimonas_sp.AAC.1